MEETAALGGWSQAQYPTPHWVPLLALVLHEHTDGLLRWPTGMLTPSSIYIRSEATEMCLRIHLRVTKKQVSDLSQAHTCKQTVQTTPGVQRKSTCLFLTVWFSDKLTTLGWWENNFSVVSDGL